jgi:hypothetical protein
MIDMPWRTSLNDEGPYLVVTRTPPGTTDAQSRRAIDAAQKVFEDAGYDPVQVGMGDTQDAFEDRLFSDLWKTAERAATVAAWAPRAGDPEPTTISIYFE